MPTKALPERVDTGSLSVRLDALLREQREVQERLLEAVQETIRTGDATPLAAARERATALPGEIFQARLALLTARLAEQEDLIAEWTPQWEERAALVRAALERKQAAEKAHNEAYRFASIAKDAVLQATQFRRDIKREIEDLVAESMNGATNGRRR